MKKIYIILVTSIIVIAGCYNDKEEYLYPTTTTTTCDTVNVGFASTIKPIFDSYCNNSGCHNTASRSSGVILDVYADAKNSVQNGNVICSMEWSGCSSNMPKSSPTKVDACKISQIKAWANKNYPQ
ncbi:MAG: hypothetical protein HYZ42_07095 [Bacteroidetes bacterium]|nr:hypothetical protein [Bacteroidota bacterium]